MKQVIFLATLTLFFISSGLNAHGQLFKKIKNKVEDKIEKTTDDVLNGKESGEINKKESESTTRSNTVFNFEPGDSIIFSDNLQHENLGQMPHYWKSGGSGEVVQFASVDGKWLKLNAFTTYKLDTLFAMPENFSVEFDILTRSNELKDLLSLAFGFSTNNSVSGYDENLAAKTTIHYWNEEIINFSKDVDSYNTFDFDLDNYGNATMHVSIQVIGEKMKVYLDENKILDATMFSEGRRKYFFIQPSTKINNNAEIAISNFVVSVYE